MRPFHTLTEQLASRLLANNYTVATAESCTGGGIGACLTGLAGSSTWFHGGIISYTDKSKQELLGVSLDSLKTHGAVSEAVVQEMAQGARRKLDTSLAVAVSGVAGPDGGSDEKPVGTVWIGWVNQDGFVSSRCFHFAGDRYAVREATIEAALEGLISLLEQPIGKVDERP